MNQELSDVPPGSQRGRNQLPTFGWLWRKQGSSRKTSASASLTMLKLLTVWITTNYREFLEMGIPDHLNCLLRNLYVGQEATVRNGHGTTDWFQIRKGVHQGCVLSLCLHLTYMQSSTAWEMLGWRKHKLESRLPGEVSITSDMQMTPPLWQKARRNKEPLNESERGEWKSWLKTQHSEN